MCFIAFLSLTVACKEDENELIDRDGFPKIAELNLDDTVNIKEFFSHKGGEYPFENPDYRKWKGDRYRTAFRCFHNLDEVKESKYAAGISELPPIDWQKQTLVICSIYSLTYMSEGRCTCRVYKYSDKYTIGITMLEGYCLQAIDDIAVAIVLNWKDVKNEDLNLVFDTRNVEE